MKIGKYVLVHEKEYLDLLQRSNSYLEIKQKETDKADEELGEKNKIYYAKKYKRHIGKWFFDEQNGVYFKITGIYYSKYSGWKFAIHTPNSYCDDEPISFGDIIDDKENYKMLKGKPKII